MMERKWNRRYKNNSLMIMEGLLIIDTWFLIKGRQFLKLLLKSLIPTLKRFLYPILVTGLFFAYADYSKVKFYIGNDREFFCKNSNSTIGKYSEIDKNLKFNTMALREELIRLRFEKTHLEKSLHRMSLQFKNLYLYHKNIDTNLADFASEAIGGIVIDTPNTSSYYKPNSIQMTLFGIPIWTPNYYTPRKIIQPWTQAGECWAFRGSQGKIEIKLAYKAFIDHVTLEHISASASLTGKIDSAPKSFNVLGKTNNEYVIIDTFMYKDKGTFSQTFKITNLEMIKIPFERVMLEILSNWGNINYTCIYRFKVHGKMYDQSNDKIIINVQ